MKITYQAELSQEDLAQAVKYYVELELDQVVDMEDIRFSVDNITASVTINGNTSKEAPVKKTKAKKTTKVKVDDTVGEADTNPEPEQLDVETYVKAVEEKVAKEAAVEETEAEPEVVEPEAKPAPKTGSIFSFAGASNG